MIRSFKIQLAKNKCIHLNKVALFHLGYWPNGESINSWGSLFRYFLPRLDSLLVIIYGLIVFPQGVALYWGRDITGMCECLILTIAVIVILQKGCGLAFNPEPYQTLTIKLEDLTERYGPLSSLEQAMCDKTQSLTNQTVVLIFISAILIGIYLLTLLPVCIAFRRLYVGGWYPYDVTASPYFEVSLVVLMILITQTILAVLSDTLFLAILIQTTGQFELLRHRLKYIRELASEKDSTRNCTLPERLLHQEILSTEASVAASEDQVMRNRQHSDYVTVPEMEPVAGSLSGDQNVETVQQISQTWQDVEQGVEIRLANCVRHHVELCSFVSETETVFFVHLLTDFLYALIGNAIIIIWITQVNSVDIGLKAGGPMVMALIAMGELYAKCVLSDKITEEGYKIRDAVYEMDWLDASPAFKRSMRIIMSRANAPVEIKAAGYIPLSKETFANVMNLSYSCYKTLRAKFK